MMAVRAAALIYYALGMGAKVYEAEAKLRLRLGETNLLNLPKMGGKGPSEISAPLLINNHLTELKSRPFLEHFSERFDPAKLARYSKVEGNSLSRKDQLMKVLELYKPGKPAPAKLIFVSSLSSAARVEPRKQSHIIRVVVRDTDPLMAADLANSMAKEYIRFKGQQESGQTENERDYLHEKSAELRERLEVSKNKLAKYRQSENLIEAGEARTVDSARMLQFNSAITDSQQHLIKAQNDLQTIRTTQQAGRDLSEVRVVAENPDVAFNCKEHNAKVAAHRALEPMCGRRHPQMVALAGAIETLKTALDRASNTVVTMTKTEVSNLERQISGFQGQLDSARGMAVDQSIKNIQQNLLVDQVAADRKTYQTSVESLNKADVTGQFTESGALSLSDTAPAPDKPVKPNKPIASLASFIIFGIMFIGLPVGWELFDDHILKLVRHGGSPSVNIPPAKEVSHMPVGQHPAQPMIRAPSAVLAAPPPPQIMIPGVAQAPMLARLPIIGSAHPEVVLGQLLKSEPMDAAGALSQITCTLEMQALKRSGLGGIILVTSAEAGEGKTVSAAALAAAFCHQGRSVFIMGCNAVSPTLHQWFPHAYHHSFSAHDLESLRYGNTHLFLLPAHELPAYATNKLLDDYRAWIERARHQVDWIILDGGPVLRNFADVAPLAPIATDVLLVNNPAISSPAKLRAAMNLLQPMMSSSAFRGLIVHGV
jgi:uncharacterized protein involved in exopolysaccharide biosynthesis/Mrp family chromosome partitioning ATPase